MHTSLRAALKRHNKQVPRYTSYPTAPHFSDQVGGDTVCSWLSALGDTAPVSLYIHIPYCKKLCWYCGCNTKATQQYSPVTAFLNDLFREIDIVTSHLGHKAKVAHIHLGGGSPSLLMPTDFSRLMTQIRHHFDVQPDAEIAIELDPRETTEAKVAAYALAGVTRASLGIQDFNKTVQKAINRMQPFHRVYDVVCTLRQYGINAINFDLLYGLPYQTLETINDTISLTAALKPDRISLFGYAHVPWMKKHMRLIDEMKLPGAEERIDQYHLAREKLCLHGYRPIGIDHFALPHDALTAAMDAGTLQRNFQGYTTDKAETLIGFGPSAISVFPGGYGQNISDQRQYSAAIADQRLPAGKGINVDADDKIRRRIISDLMCYGQVNLGGIIAALGLSPDRFAGEMERAKTLMNDGLVTLEGDVMSVNPATPQAQRLAASLFDAYLHPASGKHSQVA